MRQNGEKTLGAAHYRVEFCWGMYGGVVSEWRRWDEVARRSPASHSSRKRERE